MSVQVKEVTAHLITADRQFLQQLLADREGEVQAAHDLLYHLDTHAR
jgi:hypothetical protein